MDIAVGGHLATPSASKMSQTAGTFQIHLTSQSASGCSHIIIYLAQASSYVPLYISRVAVSKELKVDSAPSRPVCWSLRSAITKKREPIYFAKVSRLCSKSGTACTKFISLLKTCTCIWSMLPHFQNACGTCCLCMPK